MLGVRRALDQRCGWLRWSMRVRGAGGTVLQRSHLEVGHQGASHIHFFYGRAGISGNDRFFVSFDPVGAIKLQGLFGIGRTTGWHFFPKTFSPENIISTWGYEVKLLRTTGREIVCSPFVNESNADTARDAQKERLETWELLTLFLVPIHVQDSARAASFCVQHVR